MGYSRRTLRRFDLGEYNEDRHSVRERSHEKVVFGEMHQSHRVRTKRPNKERDPDTLDDEPGSDLFYGAMLARLPVLREGRRQR